MKVVCEQFQIRTIEFTITPNISSNENSSFHEWFIEFESLPNDIDQFALALDQQLRNRNIYYDDLVKGQILAPLKITILQKNALSII